MHTGTGRLDSQGADGLALQVHVLELLTSLHCWHQGISLAFLQELPCISKCVLKYIPAPLHILFLMALVHRWQASQLILPPHCPQITDFFGKDSSGGSTIDSVALVLGLGTCSLGMVKSLAGSDGAMKSKCLQKIREISAKSTGPSFFITSPDSGLAQAKGEVEGSPSTKGAFLGLRLRERKRLGSKLCFGGNFPRSMFTQVPNCLNLL